jgi:uncharacterized membrane protein
MSDQEMPFVDPQGEGQARKAADSGEAEAVWTFRGYRLKPSEFTTAMVHLFRAEVTRANVWRQRLDTTTNWAVVTTGAAITIAFSQATHHGVILLNTLLVTLFLYTEARRYRYYELWSYRVRLMETDFYAAMLVPPFHPAADWAESLAETLLHPDFPISMWEAFGRRLRRNYLWIYLILALAWLAKTFVLPSPAATWQMVLQQASIGPIPGLFVLAFGVIFNGLLIWVGLLTRGMHQATGEVLPRYGPGSREHFAAGLGEEAGKGVRAWFRHGRRRQQLLALIITDQAQQVGQRILVEMRRGVTSLSGTGMYTGKAHAVLLCALTATEVNNLKFLVNSADPNAFVIVSPAQEVLGRGFLPLQGEPKIGA